MNVTVKITIPSDKDSRICPRRHIAVWGDITADASLPLGCRLEATLTDAKGKVIRRTFADEKNAPKAVLFSDKLRAYPDGMDDTHEKMREFGFPELIADSDGSQTNAEVKCMFTDTFFKTFFISATDTAHGMLLDDGVNLTYADGKPYEAFLDGDYTVSVTLYLPDGTTASDSKAITVAPAEKTVICRFNPAEHKAKMLDWAKGMGFTLVSDILPGYLDSYLGTWLYHMGILSMYRASDVSLYAKGKVHMFVYLIAHDSTSYETELAYLGAKGDIAKPDRFTAFRYDIGEAVVGKGKKYERHGEIVEFPEGEYLHIYRIDKVNDKAIENHLDLSFDSVEEACYDTDITLYAGERFAITGVLRPYQFETSDYVCKPDNTYDMRNAYDTVEYRFGETVIRKPVGMTRYADRDIGDSVLEFYHIFTAKEEIKGQSVEITVYDKKGNATPAKKTIGLIIK